MRNLIHLSEDETVNRWFCATVITAVVLVLAIVFCLAADRQMDRWLEVVLSWLRP